MKFTDGYWLPKQGMSVLRPRDISAVEVDGDRLAVYAPTQKINGRGDALNCPQITVTFESPLDNVIGVTIEHFQGGVHRGPDFELYPSPGPVKIVEDESRVTFTSGDVSARISTAGDWQVDFTDRKSVV